MLRHGIRFWGALMFFALPGLLAGCSVFTPDQPLAPTPPAAQVAPTPRPGDDPELFRAVKGDLPEFLRLKKLEETYPYGVGKIRDREWVAQPGCRGYYRKPGEENPPPGPGWGYNPFSLDPWNPFGI